MSSTVNHGMEREGLGARTTHTASTHRVDIRAAVAALSINALGPWMAPRPMPDSRLLVRPD